MHEASQLVFFPGDADDRQVGFLDGNMAYNGGRLKPNDAHLDAAARRITAGVKFNRPEDRDD